MCDDGMCESKGEKIRGANFYVNPSRSKNLSLKSLIFFSPRSKSLIFSWEKRANISGAWLSKRNKGPARATVTVALHKNFHL